MKFVVKSSAESSTRIAVQFQNEHQAISLYETILRDEKDVLFTAKIELFQEKLNLQICSELNGKKFDYSQLTYSNKQMLLLIQAIEIGHRFQFFHIYSKSNCLTIAKPFKKNNFISIRSISLLNPINV